MVELNELGVHAEKLIRLIDEVLINSGLGYSMVDAVAVSEGPGSYTGLRIGVSTAKGIAFALEKPLIGISTLKALASDRKFEKGEVGIAVLDARRMEVYSQVFGQELMELSPVESVILDESAYSRFLNDNKVYFAGDAVGKVKQFIRHPNAIFMEHSGLSARLLGKLAWEKYQSEAFEDIAYFVPNYLKEFQALYSRKNPLVSL